MRNRNMIEEEILAPEIDDVTTDNKAPNETDALLELSSNSTSDVSAEKEHGNRTFDADKVARIRAQLAFGTYEINPERIVSKMIGNST